MVAHGAKVYLRKITKSKKIKPFFFFYKSTWKIELSGTQAVYIKVCNISILYCIMLRKDRNLRYWSIKIAPYSKRQITLNQRLHLSFALRHENVSDRQKLYMCCWCRMYRMYIVPTTILFINYKQNNINFFLTSVYLLF